MKQYHERYLIFCEKTGRNPDAKHGGQEYLYWMNPKIAEYEKIIGSEHITDHAAFTNWLKTV